MSVHHYAFATVPLVVLEDRIPNDAKPHQHAYTCRLDLPRTDESHLVLVSAFVKAAPVVSEVASFWGNLSHDATADDMLTIYAKSVERFEWAKLDGKPFTHAWLTARSRLHEQGT